MAVGEPAAGALPTPRLQRVPAATLLPWSVAGLAFLILFWSPISGTFHLWLTDPDANHGLLLVPLAVVLAWRRGLVGVAGQPLAGLVLLAGAIALRYVGGLATELYTMRLSALGAALGLVVFAWGWRQLLHWWLPVLLVLLSVPLPEILLGTLALPLQLEASRMGAWLLEARDVPVHLAGNVIQLPGHRLFVTEACSGLRSLTALLALGLLIGGLWLHTTWARLALVAVSLPIAMLLNGVRIFLTGFFVYYVDPALGEGLMHYTEGWVMFVVAFVILGGVAWLLARLERRRVEAE